MTSGMPKKELPSFKKWPLPANVKTWRRWAVALGLMLSLMCAVGVVYLPYFFASLPTDLYSQLREGT